VYAGLGMQLGGDRRMHSVLSVGKSSLKSIRRLEDNIKNFVRDIF
jgi:hypothetical protein